MDRTINPARLIILISSCILLLIVVIYLNIKPKPIKEAQMEQMSGRQVSEEPGYNYLKTPISLKETQAQGPQIWFTPLETNGQKFREDAEEKDNQQEEIKQTHITDIIEY